MTTDPNVADPVKLAAIKDALDRSGIQAKTAVSVEVSTKPFELVFDSIVAGPRDPTTPPALAELPESDNAAIESESDEIVGEIDDDEIDDDLPRLQRDRESADVVDVEVVDTGYTDDSPGTTTPVQDQTDLSEPLSPTLGPLGMNGPVGSGMLSLQDANEAVAEMRAREAARVRNLRRRSRITLWHNGFESG